jgi:hypothetical protein
MNLILVSALRAHGALLDRSTSGSGVSGFQSHVEVKPQAKRSVAPGFHLRPPGLLSPIVRCANVSLRGEVYGAAAVASIRKSAAKVVHNSSAQMQQELARAQKKSSTRFPHSAPNRARPVDKVVSGGASS